MPSVDCNYLISYKIATLSRNVTTQCTNTSTSYKSVKRFRFIHMNITGPLHHIWVLCVVSTLGPVCFDQLFKSIPRLTLPQANKTYFPFDEAIKNYKYAYANLKLGQIFLWIITATIMSIYDKVSPGSSLWLQSLKSKQVSHRNYINLFMTNLYITIIFLSQIINKLCH
jgi:hypothetical protein